MIKTNKIYVHVSIVNLRESCFYVLCHSLPSNRDDMICRFSMSTKGLAPIRYLFGDISSYIGKDALQRPAENFLYNELN